MMILCRAARATCVGAVSLGLAATLGPADAAPSGHRDTHGVDVAALVRSDRGDSTAARQQVPLRPGWGKAFARNQKLRQGCHVYALSYNIKIPEEGRDDWAAEFFITNSRGKAVASPVVIVGADPLRGQKKYRLCRPSTGYGRYKLATKVTYQDDARNLQEGRLRPMFFRLYRP